MLLTNNFLNKVDNLERKIEERIRQFDPKPEFAEVFLDSVDLWLIELYGSNSSNDERCRYILDFAESQEVIEIVHIVYKAIKPNKLINLYRKVFNMNINTDIKTIIVIALGITGLGFLLFTLNQSNKSTDQKQTIPKLSTVNYQHLILVISATKADILDTLSINHSPDNDLCDKLYQSTKFIWFGSKQQSLALFDDIFSERGVGYGNESEYDVYFVKIEIKDYSEDGFNSGVSSIKRIDAFRNLSDLGKILDISKRLPANAYQQRNLYNR
jgi:hypothetical protein